MARTLTDTERDRAAVLAEEGMPATWIADDLDVGTAAVRNAGIHLTVADQTAWRSEWGRIRRNPTLYALHTEFAPTVR